MILLHLTTTLGLFCKTLHIWPLYLVISVLMTKVLEPDPLMWLSYPGIGICRCHCSAFCGVQMTDGEWFTIQLANDWFGQP